MPLLRVRDPQTRIVTLLNNEGTTLSNQKDFEEEVLRFYSNLVGTKITTLKGMIL